MGLAETNQRRHGAVGGNAESRCGWKIGWAVQFSFRWGTGGWEGRAAEVTRERSITWAGSCKDQSH